MNLTPRQWLIVSLFAVLISMLLTPWLIRHLHNRNLSKGA
jgi:UDP-N-acetylmuramyl pentapeptide phosphotransferase/UDP-N-acetylglucosamine-1-phosphate transferase